MKTLQDVSTSPAIQEWLINQQTYYHKTKNRYYLDTLKFALEILRTEDLKRKQGLSGGLE